MTVQQAQPQPPNPAAAPEAQPPAAPEPTRADKEAAALAEAADLIQFHDVDPMTGDHTTPPEPPAPPVEPGAMDDEQVLVAAAAELKKYRDGNAENKAVRDQLSARMTEWEKAVDQVKTPQGAMEFVQKYGGKDWLLKAAEQARKDSNPTETDRIDQLMGVIESLKEGQQKLRDEIKGRDSAGELAGYENQIEHLMNSDPKYGIVLNDPVARTELNKFLRAWHKDRGTLKDLPPQDVLDTLTANQVARLSALRENEAWQVHFGQQQAQPAPVPPTTPVPPAQQLNGQPPGPSHTNHMPPRGAPPHEDDIDPRDDEARIRAAAALLRFHTE